MAYPLASSSHVVFPGVYSPFSPVPFFEKSPSDDAESRKKKVRWTAIAAEMPGRVGKQCRERWHNQLCPDLKRGKACFPLFAWHTKHTRPVGR